jgi:predicted GH43/DUF377 family glycosyl hydrolase
MRIQRTGISLAPDCRRVLLRPFDPMPEERFPRIIGRILALDERGVESLLDDIFDRFESRHPRFRSYLLGRCERIQSHVPEHQGTLTDRQKLLIGAYFTLEYAFECSALFNPSIVWHPDQTGLEPGKRRFILSLRCTGEGHISSLGFRTGTIDTNNQIEMDQPGSHAEVGELVLDAYYERDLFTRKLREIDAYTHVVDDVLDGLAERFTMRELQAHLAEASHRFADDDPKLHEFKSAANHILTLAKSNYSVSFPLDQTLSERIIFPTAPSELHGIEDARFVRFEKNNGAVRYYATYTAYSDNAIVPQLIETEDFVSFNMSTLNGPEIHNKGIALFPRKIGGQYAMLSRQGNENIYLMLSEHSHFWYTKREIVAPVEPWEFVQLGNCGSPIETDRGWLVLIHGVGPMRTYSISAMLLDLEDPCKVIGRLHEPLLVADATERDGYVPNVVYSCGAIVNGDSLILPYAVSDYSSSFAIVSMPDLMDRITS